METQNEKKFNPRNEKLSLATKLISIKRTQGIRVKTIRRTKKKRGRISKKIVGIETSVWADNFKRILRKRVQTKFNRILH